jgi:hypothetical protein
MSRNAQLAEGQVYYLTCNVENGGWAADLAAVQGLTLQTLFPKDLPLPPDALALIVDLDNLWLDNRGRCAWVAGLDARPPAVPTVVHSYDYWDEEVSEIKNVVLARRLDDGLLSRLAGLLTGGTSIPLSDPPDTQAPEQLDEDEIARILLGSDGGPLCD